MPTKNPITVTTLVEPIYLNPEQLAQAIGVSRRTVDNWKDQHVVPLVKVRGVVRFDLAKVKAALERRFEVHEKSAPTSGKRRTNA
jgi:excisionase family DNA binding protein